MFCVSDCIRDGIGIAIPQAGRMAARNADHHRVASGFLVVREHAVAMVRLAAEDLRLARPTDSLLA